MGSNLHLIKMFSLLLISLTISMAVGQTPPHPTEDGIACEECVREMHRFGQLIHDGREAMAGYLAENYCATPWAPADLSRSSPVRSASKEWSGLRLTWKTP